MDCFCVNVSENDFFQLGYSSDPITLRIEFFFYKLGLRNFEEIDVLPCVFTDKTGPTTEEGCPLPYITISKGPENVLIVAKEREGHNCHAKYIVMAIIE